MADEERNGADGPIEVHVGTLPEPTPASELAKKQTFEPAFSEEELERRQAAKRKPRKSGPPLADDADPANRQPSDVPKTDVQPPAGGGEPR